MATSLKRRDHMLRLLANATPGTTDPTRDYLGRVNTATVDYMGRANTGPAWIATTAYALGDYVTEVATGKVLVATDAGTSDAAEPTAPGYGLTVVDDGVVWTQVTS